jgi:hypothetical protein
MLDVEYLLAPSGFTDVLVYRYRSGVLRRAMLSALREIAAADSQSVFRCKVGELFTFLLGGSFFTGLMVCDWSQEKLAKPQLEIAEVLGLLASDVVGPVALLVRDGDAFLQHPNWNDLQKVCIDV